MALLVGRYVNKIDRKGRVSMPKAFRDAFAQEPHPGVYVFPSFKHPAIEGCGEGEMRRFSASLDELNLFSDEQDDLAAVILENASQLAFDPEGRVILSDELMAHARITDQAVFVGRGSRFQIWAPEEYKAHAAEAFARARSSKATLKLRREGEE